MPTPRCRRCQSVIEMPASPSITPLDAVLGDPHPSAPDRWPCVDGRLEVRPGTRFTPAALVQLAAACYALRHAGHQPVLRAEAAAVRDYLWRCGLLAVVRPVAAIEPPPGPSPLLLNVTRLATGADLPPLLDHLVGVLRQRLHYRDREAFDVATAVSEVCQNTFDHNTDSGAFLALQVVGRGGRRSLEIGLADHGAGLAATLRRNPRYAPLASDREAIQLAVQRGTSAYNDATRGTGLYHLLALVARQAGAVEIRSGTAAVRYRRAHPRGWASTVPWRPGVHVALTLPTPVGVDRPTSRLYIGCNE
jgi:anti-sigma regulatory factor (Ser/Thr protein kinase)